MLEEVSESPFPSNSSLLALPLSNVTALLRFLERAFSECPEALKVIANALWPELQTYILERYILETLPASYADIKSYDAHLRVGQVDELATALGMLVLCGELPDNITIVDNNAALSSRH